MSDNIILLAKKMIILMIGKEKLSLLEWHTVILITELLSNRSFCGFMESVVAIYNRPCQLS